MNEQSLGFCILQKYEDHLAFHLSRSSEHHESLIYFVISSQGEKIKAVTSKVCVYVKKQGVANN
jgi:hypothetical protein